MTDGFFQKEQWRQGLTYFLYERKIIIALYEVNLGIA